MSCSRDARAARSVAARGRERGRAGKRDQRRSSSTSTSTNTGGAFLQAGDHRLLLVRSADLRCDRPTFASERIGGTLVVECVEHRLGPANRSRAERCDLTGQRQGVLVGRVARSGHQPQLGGLGTREHPSGVGQLTSHVRADQLREHERPGHVRHEPPVDLADRHLRVGMCDADVRSEGELEAAAERMTVDRGDHRHRQFLPDPAHLLTEVGDPTIGHPPGVTFVALRRFVTGAADRLHAGHVEPGTERRAVAREHHGSNARFGLQSLTRLGDRQEHRRVQRIALVGAREANVGDAVRDADGNTFGHERDVARPGSVVVVS